MKYVFIVMIVCALIAMTAFSESFAFYKSRKTKRRNLCIGFAFTFIALDAYIYCTNYD